MAIDSVRIFPSIGIARLGNSPEAFFIGPELPGDRTPPAGGYKDAHCRVKRQAARFRVFGYDNGVLQQELTLAEADIEWTVELANSKGSWHAFGGIESQSLPRRNGTDAVAPAPFNITPGPRTLTGPDQQAAFNTGAFMGVPVPLGEMRTDADGRLLVLGGFGGSASPTNAPIVHWANNDAWHDDVSDGPVRASVRLKNTSTWMQASPAWVICAPPKFAPAVDNIITLYDVLYQVAVETFGLVPPAMPSFTKDIHPLLARAMGTKWVSSLANSAHLGFGSVIPPPGSAADRQTIFSRLRDPALGPHQPGGDMPRIWSDVFDTAQSIPAALTKTQYTLLKQWKNNVFLDDWTGVSAAPDTVITPDGLTRAALENCVGAAFFPGIETSFLTRDAYPYLEPFRLDADQLKAGDLTKQMAVPWQADFWDCKYEAGKLWWPAQRPDEVFPEGGGPQVKWTRDLVNGMEDMIADWYRLGFVVQQGNQLVETERHVVCKSCFIIIDRSTFSKDQVQAVGLPADFDGAFYIVVEGFKPSELGVSGSGMTPAQLAPVAPVPAFHQPDATITPGMSASARSVLLEDANVNVVQRVTFVYRISFTNTSAFAHETDIETLTGSIAGLECAASVLLTHQPNPYMLDGTTTWLSIDLRVFQLTEGGNRFGHTIGNDAAGALQYINSVLVDFNTAPAPNHPFDTLSMDQQLSKLELSRSVNGKRVFNFAVAKVRFVGSTLSADDVRLFFRLFTTAATGLDFDASSTYRSFDDGTKAVPLLGFEGGQVVTIPCFATARVDPTAVSMTTQPDDAPNVRTLLPGGPNEVHGYFGCWLDFNQTEARIPTLPFAGDGGYGVNAKSIQDTVRGLHQCLVAEIHFAGQPIPHGAGPASNDKLSQRNLAIVESDNPGGRDAHTVVHTFELKPSQPVRVPRVPALVDVPSAAGASPRSLRPDELMIRWYDLPRDTEATLYMPSVSADELLGVARRRYEARRLERVDEHTIRCLLGDVTYVPVPAGPGPNIAGLITLVLPDHVKTGQFFHAVVCQVSGATRHTIGSFQLSVPVADGPGLLEAEARALSVLRSVSLTIPSGDRWRPVFDRYLAVIAGRVRGFGGNPDAVAPSPDGRVDLGDLCAGRRHDVATAIDLLRLGIPWGECDVDGELQLRLRFRRR